MAKEFEPCAHTIYGWVRQSGRSSDAVGAMLKDDEGDELRRLRKENKQLRLERDILSKAAAWFTQNDGASFRSSSS